jgi:thiol-disulfide isomerase/thioredoxin
MKTGDDRGKREALSSLSFRGLPTYAALAAVALFAGTMAAVRVSGDLGKQGSSFPPEGQDRMIGSLIRHAEPQSVADLVFTEGGSQVRQLSEWRGKTVILNLWATWCAPCKAEMPSLDRLQSRIGGDGFAVIALSMDRRGLKEPIAFFASQGIKHLKLYNDNTGQASIRLKAPGLPFTAVLNEKGEEVARVTGPAEWDSDTMIAQLKSLR